MLTFCRRGKKIALPWFELWIFRPVVLITIPTELSRLQQSDMIQHVELKIGKHFPSAECSSVNQELTYLFNLLNLRECGCSSANSQSLRKVRNRWCHHGLVFHSRRWKETGLAERNIRWAVNVSGRQSLGAWHSIMQSASLRKLSNA